MHDDILKVSYIIKNEPTQYTKKYSSRIAVISMNHKKVIGSVINKKVSNSKTKDHMRYFLQRLVKNQS